MSPRRLFRTLALAEAVTWTLLIVGMLLKYVVRAGDVGVRVGGSIHGFVFLLFLVAVAVVAVNQRWSLRLTLVAVASAVVPYATIPFEVAVDRRGLLGGDWRREATGDPQHARPLDRLLRWVLAHTALAAVVGVIGVALVFTLLLVVGPPGGASPIR
ncbi:hypothetical protein AS850_04100 [Frondihabitans sp. 762G35]|uniref:DUF3817 domain-containing protein n=1 Tax=Frondihabitans sp. 762G35 TaxID=1446794 RepID=UPI000D2233AC|nr:DUF3817 domain-containing protein [Frondihabitans sp. 762G35]ARC56257.1 hypothetical protein AS850_04100 [Frondihabitans sp. 762G35]